MLCGFVPSDTNVDTNWVSGESLASSIMGSGEHTSALRFFDHSTYPAFFSLCCQSSQSMPCGTIVGDTLISLLNASATHALGTVISRACLNASVIFAFDLYSHLAAS